MKIGVIRKENATEVWSTCTMETFLEKVKKETKGKYISQLRERLPSLQGSEGRFIHLDKIPRVYPVAEFRRTKDGSWKFKEYNGIVLVEVNNLSGLAEAEFVKSKAALLPQTFATLVGSSGRSVKIWVRFSLPDGSLPDTEEQASLFHAQAYRVAVQCYQPLIPFPITLKEPSLKQSIRMTVDETPYHHPEAAALCLEQPVALSDGTSFREQKLAEENPLVWLMAMDIFNHLQSKTREKLALGKLNHLGRLLKKWNTPNKRWGKGSLYYLKKLSDVEKV